MALTPLILYDARLDFSQLNTLFWSKAYVR